MDYNVNMDPEIKALLKDERDLPVRDGIYMCLDAGRVTGPNRRQMDQYNKVAPFYDLPYKFYNLATRGGEKRARLEYLRELEVGPGDKVLEVAVGTGANLRLLPPDARYFGLDISLGMLGKCRKNLKRWRRRADLFFGEAENLPFADNVFDVVFHIGGINFFNDKAAAINEMIRVAKPGTKLLLVDETEAYARRAGTNAPIIHPTALVPGEMQEVDYEDARGTRLWRLTFRKPR